MVNVFIARQPIFDVQQKVYGYELLFRSGPENFYTATDGDQATLEVIHNFLLLIGAGKLTGGKKAFVNFTRNLLLNGTALYLPKELAILEILEDVTADERTLAACRKLKEMGYLLALDDVARLDEATNLLADVVDFIKVDFKKASPAARQEIARHCKNLPVKLLSEKTENHEEFQEAARMGFSLFQGHFFSMPVIIARKDIPGYKLNYLGLLKELSRQTLDFKALQKVIERDTSLSYKLLKYLNSAFFARRQEVISINHALKLLGEAEIRKWATLITLMQLGKDQPRELIRTSLLRARFCESLAPKLGLESQKAELFLLGMFSLIDVFLGRPLEELLEDMPLSAKVKGALMGRDNAYRPIYELILNYENADWGKVATLAAQLGLQEQEIPEAYEEAIKWVESPFWF